MVPGVGASCTLAASLSVTVFTDHLSLPHADASGAERAKHATSRQTLIRRGHESVTGVIAALLRTLVRRSQHTRVSCRILYELVCRGNSLTRCLRVYLTVMG